jgi:hypothetical protein
MALQPCKRLDFVQGQISAYFIGEIENQLRWCLWCHSRHWEALTIGHYSRMKWYNRCRRLRRKQDVLQRHTTWYTLALWTLRLTVSPSPSQEREAQRDPRLLAFLVSRRFFPFIQQGYCWVISLGKSQSFPILLVPLLFVCWMQGHVFYLRHLI